MHRTTIRATCAAALMMLAAPLQANDALVAELQPLVDRMAEIYAADPNGSNELFDELWLQEENIVYGSEQFPEPWYGFKAAAAYWQPSWNTLYGYRELYSGLEATYLAPDIALATLEVRYDMHAVTRTPLAGWTRLALILRKTDAGWKIQQYYEAPMSLISQGRVIHEIALDPEFTDFARAQNPQYDDLVNADENIQQRKAGTPWVPAKRFRPPVWETESASSEQGGAK